MSQLLLATEGGQVVRFDPVTKAHEMVFFSHDDEAMMGIEIYNGHLYVASLSRIYKLRLADFELIKKTALYAPSPDFHQHQFYDGILYTTITKRNQIWLYDEDLNLIEKRDVQTPKPGRKAVYKKNYNHINNIVKHENKFYVNLNWLTNVQYAASGVAVFDKDWNELERFEYGWETHDFQFLDGKPMAILGTSSKRKKIHHPRVSGILLDGERIYEHNADYSFCKGLTYDDENFYLCGGKIMTRRLRKQSNGVIYIVNRKDPSVVEHYESEDIKAVKGVTIMRSNT